MFFDVRLSGNDTYACATCHMPAHGWTDGRARAVGESGIVLPRRTPTLFNVAWDRLFFWDGRAATLEDQAFEPPKAIDEMNQPMAALVAELADDSAYRKLVAAAYPDRSGLSGDVIVGAIATFERTLVSPEAPFDRWIAGDENAIGAAAKRGFGLFNGKANCAACHQGWAFTDGAFHDIGLPTADRGRGGAIGSPQLDHAFKTPTLRDVTRRGPYMHDGSIVSLRAVLDHYTAGIVQRPTLSDDLKQVALTGSEKDDLLAFLATLAGPQPGQAATGLPQPRPAPAAAPVPPLHGFGDAVPGPVPNARGASTPPAISQKDRSFRPDRVSLAVGGVLRIANDDTRKHNVRVSAPDLEINSGIQAPGETVTLTFPRAGDYEAFCGIHPKMRLGIRVAE